MCLLILVIWFCADIGITQYVKSTTPVPILKQINRHNEDGSYSYGYEAADGSYKIESKYPTGEVYGKYGFIDDIGNLREIEYGASRRGFEPTGTGINVPPPTIHENGVAGGKYDLDDDGQYREDPSFYYTNPRYTNRERYELMSNILDHQLQQRPFIHGSLFSKSVAEYYGRPGTQLDYQEYQPMYRTQYQRQNRLAPTQYLQLQPQYKHFKPLHPYYKSKSRIIYR